LKSICGPGQEPTGPIGQGAAALEDIGVKQALAVRHSLRAPTRLLPRTLPALHFLACLLRGGAGLLAAGLGVCVTLSLDNWHWDSDL